MLQDSRAATVPGDAVNKHREAEVQIPQDGVQHFDAVLGEPPRGRAQKAMQMNADRKALTGRPTFSGDRKRERQAARQLRKPTARSGLQAAWAQQQGPQNQKAQTLKDLGRIDRESYPRKIENELPHVSTLGKICGDPSREAFGKD